ncbi:MAG: toprim domain-containing protein, partial [Kiritimatiellaeota bacterium]|nr:toprim domain-containing protein [Kiritimatiellota bacterium]
NDSGNIYDRFRNRLMFTISDEQGRVVGFSGRSVEKDPQGGKYVNTPETPLFKKSRILYALSLARDSIKELGHVILCEGQMDTIALHRAGFKNAVAPQGTAFTDEQARMLKRHTDKVRIAFDSDSAGVKATIRAIEIMLPIGFDIQVVDMPPDSDPDQIFAESGADGLRKELDAAVDFFDFALENAKEQNDVSSPWGKSAVTDHMLGLIGHITKDVLRAEYASKLATELQLPENAVFMELNKNNRRNAAKSVMTERRRVERISHPENEASETAAPSPPTVESPPNIAKAESYLLELALSHGTVGRELSEELPTAMISDTPLGRALNLVISMTLNDEWEQAGDAVRDILLETPDPDLSRVLAAPELFRNGSEDANILRRKALDDCVRCIKTQFVKNELKPLKKQIASEDAAENVIIAYQEKLKELRELEPEKKRLKPRKRAGKSDEDNAGGGMPPNMEENASGGSRGVEVTR